VKVLLDQRANTGHYSDATYLERMDVSVSIDSEHTIAHNKVIVIDDTTLITGSFNFTKAAEERNAENVLIIYDPALAGQYVKNWKLHAAHSQPFTERAAGSQNLPAPDVADAEQDSTKIGQGLPTQGQIVGNRRSAIYA
jgi:phosphatidylserine/phosphatidylglycerophosphate/cardiolipin synthase-like enzyme